MCVLSILMEYTKIGQLKLSHDTTLSSFWCIQLSVKIYRTSTRHTLKTTWAQTCTVTQYRYFASSSHWQILMNFASRKRKLGKQTTRNRAKSLRITLHSTLVVFTAFRLTTFTQGNLHSPTCWDGEAYLSLEPLQGDSSDLFILSPWSIYAEYITGL